MSSKYLITEAIKPMKESAITLAENRMKAVIDKTLEGLQATNWDRKLYAPLSKSFNISKTQYRQEREKYYFVQRITKSLKPCLSPNEPDFCEISQEGIAKLMKDAKEEAGFTFEKFTCKLSQKIGENVVSVKAYAKEELWTESLITVTDETGTVSTWKTKQIVNCSVYGKLFFQWPTRVVK